MICVLVAYNPDRSIISKTIGSLVSQVDKVYIVDNTESGNKKSDIFFEFEGIDKVELISLGKNTGIARAQNIGILKALENRADYILLSDQDSEFPADYVSEMLKHLESLPDKEKVAAIAPDFAEMKRGGVRQGFVIFEGFFLNKIFPTTGCHRVSQVIASGKILSTSALKEVGLMDEDLFIDWVDLEWCWRSKAKGYFLIGCADIVIKHSLGDIAKTVMKKTYPVRSPARHYYIVRNAVHLSLRSDFLNARMRVHLIIKSIRNLIGFTILGRPRLTHLRYCLLGFYHGFIGRLGAL